MFQKGNTITMKTCCEKIKHNNVNFFEKKFEVIMQNFRPIKLVDLTILERPIFKNNIVAISNNYRQFSLLSNVLNVSQKLIFIEIYEFVRPSLDNSQKGFRRHMSVLTQLLLFSHKTWRKRK